MNSRQAVHALSALAHSNRLGVYRLLVEAGPEGLSAGTIAGRLKMPPSSLTFHLKHLQHTGLIARERSSRQVIYSADFGVMNELVGYLTENCCGGGSPASCDPVRPARKA